MSEYRREGEVKMKITEQTFPTKELAVAAAETLNARRKTVSAIIEVHSRSKRGGIDQTYYTVRTDGSLGWRVGVVRGSMREGHSSATMTVVAVVPAKYASA